MIVNGNVNNNQNNNNDDIIVVFSGKFQITDMDVMS